jgi:tetratricopeptide (TPR) repeat protein
MKSFPPLLIAALLLVPAAPVRAQATASPIQLAEGQKLIASGDLAGGIAALERAVKADPKSYEVRLALGRALDLNGRHATARLHLEEAVRLAPAENQSGALSALGISYAFESKPDESARYYQRAFDALMQADNASAAAGTANALGRIYLESGSLDKAEQWYTTGYETSKKIAGATPEESRLWEMRRHNALGRIAARRGDQAAARKHADAALALLEKGGNDNQRPFHPYLLGYIAFFGKDYKGAIAELQKGDQDDPFVLGMIAQSYERLGQKDRAAEYYRRVMADTNHSVNAAFSRPKARAFLR